MVSGIIVKRHYMQATSQHLHTIYVLHCRYNSMAYWLQFLAVEIEPLQSCAIFGGLWYKMCGVREYMLLEDSCFFMTLA